MDMWLCCCCCAAPPTDFLFLFEKKKERHLFSFFWKNSTLYGVVCCLNRGKNKSNAFEEEIFFKNIQQFSSHQLKADTPLHTFSPMIKVSNKTNVVLQDVGSFFWQISVFKWNFRPMYGL